MYTHGRQPTADLPELASGITLVDVDADLGVTPVQALLLDQTLAGDGDAYWVDGEGAARTARLTELTPSFRVLDRIQVARGFTAEQHSSLIDRLGGRLDERPSIVVATGLDRLYRDDDVPADRAETMFVRAIAAVARVARIHDVPAIVTRVREDTFSRPVVNAARAHLRCRGTPFGPRFEDDAGEHETLVYHTGGGWIQTTLDYWQEVLEHRARIHEASTRERRVATVGVQ